MPLTPEQQAEIDRQRAETQPTRRAISPGLEEILYQAVPVLDHGFVRVIDYMGDDAAVVQAARVSYGKGTKKVTEDRGLIHYLMRHQHTTPFEMCEIKYHVKLPIFVARQWIRHRTANVNEYSARYSILDNEFYVPAPEQLAAQSATNRQGRGEVLPPDQAARVLDLLRRDAAEAYRGYVEMLNEDDAGKVIDEKRTGLARDKVSAAASMSSSRSTNSTPARRSAASNDRSAPPQSSSRRPGRIATTGRSRAAARAADRNWRWFLMRRMSSRIAPVRESRDTQSSVIEKPMPAFAPIPMT